MHGSKSWFEMGKEEFSLDSVAHELVDMYKPAFLDKGSDQIVYQSPKHPGVVIKVSVDSIEFGLRWLNETGNDPKEMHSDPEVAEKLELWLETKKEHFQKVREYFGTEHILAQRFVTLNVPRVPDIVDAVARLRTGYDVFQDHLPDELVVVATIQKTAKEVLNNKFESIDLPYSYDEQEGYYDMARNALFRTGQPIDLELPDSYFNNEGKVEALKDFVSRAVSYSTETGSILDIAGSDNLILIEDDNGYNYKLLDAVYPDHHRDTLSAIRQAFNEYISSNFQSTNVETQVHDVINGVHYVTFINGLAERLGMNDRIDYFSDMADEKSWSMILPYLKKQREEWLHQDDPDDY